MNRKTPDSKIIEAISGVFRSAGDLLDRFLPYLDRFRRSPVTSIKAIGTATFCVIFAAAAIVVAIVGLKQSTVLFTVFVVIAALILSYALFLILRSFLKTDLDPLTKDS